MIDKKAKTIIKIILPIIFIIYASSITFFTHTHVINGVTIVHSHPYQSNDDGALSHNHTGAEIQLIHTLSTFFSVAVIVLSILLGLLSLRKSFIQPKTYLFILQEPVWGLSRLRPPPFILYSL